MKLWSEIKSEFEADGSLRDIYVEDIDISAWDTFIDGVIESEFRIDFKSGDSSRSLPNSFVGIKELQRVNPTILSIWLKVSVQINCHFFVENEIELDVSPSEICNEESYTALIHFLHWLAGILNEPVKLTHEGDQSEIILYVN